MKTLVWTLLATAVTATTAALSLKALRFAWREVMHEEPPTPPRWAKLVAGAFRSKVARTAEPKGA